MIRPALKAGLWLNTSLRMCWTGTFSQNRTGLVLMPGIFFVRRVPVLICVLLVFLAGFAMRPAQAEPDEPDSAAESQPAKAPARQLPADIIEKLLQEELAARAALAAAADEPVQAGPEKAIDQTDYDAEEIERAKDTFRKAKAPESDAAEAPVTDRDVKKDDSGYGTDQMAEQAAPSVYPGLPRRKPPKPVVRRADRKKADGRKRLQRGSDRQKYLCRALQSCRNDFIRCKAKIKHPDQSPEWSEAKEACGAIYKTCVEKDFQAGEWFFTRWFYFQELNC